MNKKDYILYLEDDEIDAIKFTSTMKNLGFQEQIIVQQNGEEGLNWLSANRQLLPKIIVLDLNMPLMNGHEFLEAIKEDNDFKKIPIVVFTTSSNKVDINHSFEYQVAGYMVKPFEHGDYKNIISIIKQYWDLSAIGHI